MLASPLGKPIDRIDGRPKITGAARFAADNTPEGTAYGHLVTSTIAHGTVRAMDVRAARDAPGVLAVFTPDDPLPLAPPRTPIIQVIGVRRRPLQDHDVHYHGQIIGLVVAETFEQARDAASLIEVSYDAEPPRADFAAALASAVQPPPPFGQPVDILAEGVADIDAALAAGEIVVRGTYGQPAEQHSPLEPHAAVAWWEDDRLIVHSGTQGPALHAFEIAEAFGLDRVQVHVISPHVGGAFGGKVVTWAPTLLAAAAARARGRPVKVVPTRKQQFTVTGHRTRSLQEIALGANRDGTLTALKHDSVTELVMENPSAPSLQFYRVPNVHLGLRVVALNVPKATIMRAPGYQSGSFALECTMDELAHELGVDPVELRLRNQLTVAPDSGLPYSAKHLAECYRTGAERFGWSRRDPMPRSRADGEWLIGMGMAGGVLHGQRVAVAGRVRLRPDGTAEAATANSDMGQGTWTTLAVVAAERLGIAVDRVRPALGESTLPANPADLTSMMGAVASSATANMTAAIAGAAAQVITALIAHAVEHPGSPFHGMDPARVRYVNGRVTCTEFAVGFGELLTVTGSGGIEASHVAGQGGDDKGHAYASYAAYFAEVRVNRWTGEARPSRMTAVIDAGTIVNEKTARSQVMGAIVMGLGQALLEATELEPDTGRIANADLAGYLIPVCADMPAMDVHFLGRPDTNFTATGVRGLAELGCVGSAAAIANAVHNATGKRVRDLPITPDKLLD
jgi:xanthine dehydrogenase YagR molybdenum-binding subunit